MKHLLKLSELTKQDILKILNLADQMKYDLKHGISHTVLQGKTLAMIFTTPSTRTRLSVEVGIGQLGGRAVFLSASDIQLGRGESVEDTANVLSRYVDCIMIRTHSQRDVEELARHSCVPIINGLTDFSYPTQILADLMTIREYHATLAGRTVAFIGDGNNVCNSLIVGAAICGMNVRVATPEGYEPNLDCIKLAGEALMLTNDPQEAVAGADAVFTDVWASMGREAEEEKRKKALAPYRLDDELMKLAAPGAIVQHCLPAHKGEEITREVFERHQNEIYDEAENCLHINKAVMAILMGGIE